MYDEIIEIAENRAYLQAVKDGYGQGPNLELLKTIPDFTSPIIQDFNNKLEKSNQLTFEKVFKEPIGYYHMKLFLISDYSVDKAVFLNDVRLFKTLRDNSARKTVATLIYQRFMLDHLSPQFKTGQSVFDLNYSSLDRLSSEKGNRESRRGVNQQDQDMYCAALTLNSIGTNPIGVFGHYVNKVKMYIDTFGSDEEPALCPPTVFDNVERLVQNDLKLDVFPRFQKSDFFKRYIRCRWLELRRTSINDFDILRVLGRGAFGFVKAGIKKDSGKLYAMKCIDKKRVMATDSVDTIMAEREFLSMMDSRFVVCLKYAVMNDDCLFLVLDLMVGGDLKFHLNKDERFHEQRARFYAAEVLLGLEHIHSKGIIYRDMKLENVLLDEQGHCRISDLGLAVKTKDKVKGYAGTPGYTAPEVITNKPYNHLADFFSYGVMVYRFLSGKKPFAKRIDRKDRERRRQKNRKRGRGYRGGKSDLDKNVVDMDPEYPSTYFGDSATDFLQKLMEKDPDKRLGVDGIDNIKLHRWFDVIDFGLLEAGYLKPPLRPSQDEVNADSLRHLGRSQQDDKFQKVRLTAEFQKQLVKFPFQSPVALQEEVVEVLQKADEGKNFEKFAKTSAESEAIPAQPPQTEFCCTIL